MPFGRPPGLDATHSYAGIIWSPLTAQLKQQLDYDKTGEPNDWATAFVCSPKRALVDGKAEDG